MNHSLHLNPVRLTLLGAVVLTALLSGCSSDDETTDTDTCVGDRCGGRPDVSGGDDDTDEEGDVDERDIESPDTGSGCSPGAQVCVDATTAGVCLADGVSVTPLPCAAGETCQNGICAEGTAPVCTPGTVNGCASGSALLRCNDEGSAFVESACPADAAICRDGACESTICDAGERSCRGADIVACDADGQALSVVETCPIACSGGRCVDTDACAFDGKYYLGCDFWAVYLDNEARGLGFGLTVSNPGGNDVNFDILGPGDAVLQSGVVAGGALAFVDLSTAVQPNGSGITDSAYRVRANGPVTVHQFNPPNNIVEGYSNDASLLLPSNALGTSYRVMAYHSGDDLAIFARLSARWYVTIVATSEGTTDVTINTPAGISAGTGVTAMAPNSTSTITLQRGQVLTLMAERNNGDEPDSDDPADVTGMSIDATQPVAVFSGSEASYIPDDTGAADHIEQQLYPIDTWGTEYVVAKFAPRGGEDDIFRVMTNTAGTRLTTIPAIDGVNGRVLNNPGDAVEFLYRGDFVVQATAPISVGQFMVGSLYPGFGANCSGTRTTGCVIPLAPECGNTKRLGDPAFLLPVASSQLRTDYNFLVPEGYTENWVSIVLPTGATAELDGTAVTATPTTIAGTTWQIVRVEVAPGTHRLVSSAPSGLYVYGYGCDVSYAYPGGLNLDTE